MKASLCLIIFLLLTGYAGGQVDSVKLDRPYLGQVVTDARDLVMAPCRWGTRDWVRAAALAGTTILLTAADEPVGDFFQSRRTESLDHISRFGLEPWGNPYAMAAIGGFVAAGELFDQPRIRSTGYLAAESFLISGLLVRIPKLLAGRQRPDAWPPSSPSGFKGPFKGSSFPSGHTTAAFSVASVIAFQYGHKKWVPLVAYSVAGLTGISRMYDNRHWLSDVFAGAVVGTLTGRMICKSHQQDPVQIVPAFTGGVPGFSMTYTW
jgi:membrane-associated phospholipid phosphatase